MDFAVQFLFIFFARVFDVTLGTSRILLITKGQKLCAALIGFIEICIYITALRYVMNCLNQNLFFVLAYAGGFAAGNLVGSFVEEKMAFGHLTAQIIPSNGWQELVEELRGAGFGVTTIDGQGLTGPKVVINVSLARKKLTELNKIVEASDHGAFMTIFETKKIKGGYFLKRK